MNNTKKLIIASALFCSVTVSLAVVLDSSITSILDNFIREVQSVNFEDLIKGIILITLFYFGPFIIAFLGANNEENKHAIHLFSYFIMIVCFVLMTPVLLGKWRELEISVFYLVSISWLSFIFLFVSKKLINKLFW